MEVTMIPRLYVLYGLFVVGMMGTAEYRGWHLFTALNEARIVPKTVRDNPGSYRPVYGGFRHFTGGK
jgi:hypothetical protein